MKTNGHKDKPGGWYWLTDRQRDMVLQALQARLPEEILTDTLGLYETLRNKHLAPEPVFSSAEQVEAVETKANM